ncbi:hypothetical protein UUU_12320 [Klebsiella pneumoniae subsp. pneumoniae DSM 30104 = JCM 1662 = NBRC 14940]|nr:hypothetical protein UUU_12320 [Klebsiella pneumoniae subsp. pneumoniae DSM 30104 = JCM 1662 = NBRC 14940]
MLLAYLRDGSLCFLIRVTRQASYKKIHIVMDCAKSTKN